MKKTIYIFFLLICLFFSVKGQDTTMDSNFKKNEIKLNVLYLLVPILEVSYERILNEESSIGSRVGFGFADTDYLFEFMPYYRLFFSKKPASGFLQR